VSGDVGQKSDDIHVAERAKARSDLFNMQLKQKKIAKIKSKLYHKIKNRKARKDAGGSDEEDVESQELQRAQERMTLKHNKSKFKRMVKRFGDKEFANEALARNDELKERMRNVSRVNSLGDKVYDSDSSVDDAELLAQL
jgi:U3 small nucleolar RNA-associated protein 14